MHDQHERVTVTVHGRPSAVLIAPEDLEALEETLAIMRVWANGFSRQWMIGSAPGAVLIGSSIGLTTRTGS